MRLGVNPEKFKGERNLKKLHRVVIVFYIPNIEEDYYAQSLLVLDYCLNSLISSINHETTNITLLNNNSTSESKNVIEKYLHKIDKYVFYTENKGKVYAVMDEVRSAFEPFVTISDSDVLFFKGWEKAVFEVFKHHPKAGVVTPLPSQYAAFNHNSAAFFDAFFNRNLRYDKVVSDEDVELYLKGINNYDLINTPYRFNWKEKQYYLEGNVKAIIGATHFVATYKSMLFQNQRTFPEIKFANGYEEKFMDCLADERGLYRLSTLNSFAYHMGNQLDEVVRRDSHGEMLEKELVESIFIKNKDKSNFLVYKVKRYFLKKFKNFIQVKK
jgi:hypothetical protein